jgi:hypothetical protein
VGVFPVVRFGFSVVQGIAAEAGTDIPVDAFARQDVNFLLAVLAEEILVGE